MRQRLSSMTPAERRIASCILESPEAVINETITHLAQRANASSGSVVNFAAGMGFRGFSDMKIRIAQGLEGSRRPDFDGVNESDDPKAAMRKLMQAAQSAFIDTLAAMGDEMDRAAQRMMQARRIEIYAAGSSLPVGQDVHYRLMRQGLPAIILPEPLMACMSASQLAPDDLVIAISHSGRTKNTLAAAQMAKTRGAGLIALTSFKQSPLAALSDVCLVSVSGEARAYREAVVSRLTQLLIVDSLCAYIAAQRGMETMEYLDNEIEVLE